MRAELRRFLSLFSHASLGVFMSCMQEELVAPWQQGQQAQGAADSDASQDCDAPGDGASTHATTHPVSQLVAIDLTMELQHVNQEPTSDLAKCLDNIHDISFDVEALAQLTGGHPLLCIVVRHVQAYGLVAALQLKLAVVEKFIVRVEAAYRSVPYHSVLHAADMLANAIRLLQSSQTVVKLSPLELLAIIISCAGACCEPDHAE